MSQPNAIEFVLDALSQEGIGHVVMVPGGLIDGFLTEFGDVHGLTVVLRANLLAEMLAISQTRAQVLGLMLVFHHLTVLRSPGPVGRAFRWLAGI